MGYGYGQKAVDHADFSLGVRLADVAGGQDLT